VDVAGEHPAYVIAPRWWVRPDMWRDHTAYLARYRRKHGRPRESSIMAFGSAGPDNGVIAGAFSAFSPTVLRPGRRHPARHRLQLAAHQPSSRPGSDRYTASQTGQLIG
jgi:hypothetical protein